MDGYFDANNVILETNRLILRAWRQSDLDDFYEYASVDGVGQNAGWLPHKNKEESQEILNHFILHKNVFAIVYKENNKVIGSFGLESSERVKEYYDSPLRGREFGFVLSKDYWNQGLMTEACKRVIDYCFNELNYDFLLCAYYASNIRSKRVQEKCGFKYLYTYKKMTKMGYEVDVVVNLLKK